MVHRFLPAKGVFKLKIIWILCLYLIQNGMTQIPTFVSAYKIDSNPTEGTFDEEGNFYYFSNFIWNSSFGGNAKWINWRHHGWYFRLCISQIALRN